MFESMQVQIQRQLFLKQILEMEILVTFPFFFEEMDDYLEYLRSESSSESPLVSECYWKFTVIFSLLIFVIVMFSLSFLLFVASLMVTLEGVLWNFLQKSLVLPGFFLSPPQNNIASSGVGGERPCKWN